MTTISARRRKRDLRDLKELPAKAAGDFDDRYQLAAPLRRIINKVFPDHWSFLLGEIALFSFIILILTGTFLAFFFVPSTEPVRYNGSYVPLRGVEMTRAFETSLNLSFDVRGGLIMRQMHHWAALLFMAAILVHMSRVFFTGAFRKPREANWTIGIALFWLGFFEGFLGYGLPDDALSGTGLRIAASIMLSIPLIGSWLTTTVFGGEFPGNIILERFYILHVFLLPAILFGLIAIHIGLVFRQKHTQWPGPGRTNHNVVGERFVPRYTIKQAGFFMIVFSVVAFMGGLFQINPIWLYGPYNPAVVSAASQPDWYVMFLDGSARLFPSWSIYAYGYSVPGLFWPTVVLPGLLTVVPMLYPQIEQRLRRDSGQHNLLERPRDAPARSGLGAMSLTFFVILLLSGGNDVIADKFHINLDATVWAGRIGILILPPIAYYLTYRICLGLQQHDREVLVHGVETGIIKRLPDGRFVEVHQPLGPTDEHGHGTLEYAGWVVPKKMNRVGAMGPAVRGFLRPVERLPEAPAALPPEPPAALPPEPPESEQEQTTSH